VTEFAGLRSLVPEIVGLINDDKIKQRIFAIQPIKIPAKPGSTTI
jgi:hypothetical protein